MPEIEAELGYALFWEELQGKDMRISVALNNLDPEDQLDWPRQHEWLTARLNELYRVFVHRVKALNANEWTPDEAEISNP